MEILLKKSFNGAVVNRTSPSFRLGSFEITLTVPLRYFFGFVDFKKLLVLKGIEF